MKDVLNQGINFKSLFARQRKASRNSLYLEKALRRGQDFVILQRSGENCLWMDTEICLCDKESSLASGIE